MPSNQNTAVLIFSRFAKEEGQVKKYASLIGKKGASVLAQRLIDHTISQAEGSGITYFTIFSDQQYGNSFGEKLANSLEEIYAKGFSSVIITGTDSPSLTSDNILNLSRALETNELVITPATDGGVCLIGIQKNAYNRNAFIQNIPWQTKKVLTAFFKYAQIFNIQFSIEQPGKDIDSVSDALQWMKENSKNEIALIFKKLLLAYHTFLINYLPAFFTSRIIRSRLLLRGPPVLN